MEEIWRDIDGLNGYAISNTGLVRYKDNPLRKQGFNHKGYPYLVIRGKSMLIHRMVAKAFIPNPDNLPTVNHIDGNKTNNHVTNLEWATHSDNIRHSYRIGIRQNPKNMLGKFGYENHASKEVIVFDLQGHKIGSYGSTAVAGEALSLDGSSISKVCRGERKRAGKYRFAYSDELLKQLES